ncbi:tripartite tricarboxylate transporter TctB family protein [Micromonospora sp. H33]|uniref:tripartite tricarboxylate transporter TctB family protein n=1 Tax=Micromonospora sp. H33 TaxID=3452215 RepID=UPI003F8A6D78
MTNRPTARESAETVVTGSTERAASGQAVKARPAWSPSAFRLANIGGAAATVAFGVALLLAAQSYAFRVGQLPGPGLFPTLIGGALVALGALWLVGGLRGRYRPDGDVEPPPDRRIVGKALTTFAVIGGYAVLLRPLGYLLCSALAVSLFTALAGARWRTALITGPLFAVATFLLVTTALGIQLPYGVLAPFLGPLL